MNLLARLLIIAALILLTAALFIEASKLVHAESPDPSRLVLVFVLTILVAVALGGMVAVSVVPRIGEWIGSFFFNPNEKVGKNVHADAMAAMNRGDWEDAIVEFEKILEGNPTDSMSINNIVQIYTDRLEDPHRAIAFLEEQLEDEWPPDHSAFLASRLVDVYWGHFKDTERARQILMQIAESMPDTRHAANALHRLRKIEHGPEE